MGYSYSLIEGNRIGCITFLLMGLLANAAPAALANVAATSTNVGLAKQPAQIAQAAEKQGPKLPAEVLVWAKQYYDLNEKGRYKDAAALLEKVLTWAEQTLGPESSGTAYVLIFLADLYGEDGSYSKAETLSQRALAINEKLLGPDHPDTAKSLNKLAKLYQAQGSLTKAENLYLRAATIYSKALEKKLLDKKPLEPGDIENAAELFKGLGSLYADQGNYVQAESSLVLGLAINRRVFGLNHRSNAELLNMLGDLYREQLTYTTAEPILQQALAINEKVLGADHPATAVSLNSIAELYRTQGAYAKAIPLFLRSLAIKEKVLGPDHPATAVSLNNLALVYQNQGAYAKAEPLLLRALAIIEKSLGPAHPITASSLNNLAVLYQNQGAYAKAEAFLRRGIQGETLFLQTEVPLLPETRRQAQIEVLGRAWEAAYTFAGPSPAGTDLALFTRLNRHGLLEDIERRQALLARAPGPQRELSLSLVSLTGRLSKLDLPAPQRAALEKRRQELEQELYRQLPALTPQLVSAAQVARALPSDGVLIEFQRFEPYDARQKPDRRWGKPRYLALVLQPSGTTASVDLGPAAPIDRLVAQAIAVSERGVQPAEPLWQQLVDALFKPLQSQLTGRRRWFLSPDAELNRIPYAALPAPGQPSKRLPQAIALRLLTSGRDLLTNPTAAGAPAPGRPLVLANPDFGGTQPWSPLPFTLNEGLKIAAQISAQLLDGRAATTAALREARGPRVLHIASHGFFRTPPAKGGDPLLLSGIVLAGANTTTQVGGDDGYLTAKEAAQLQLDGTLLVVLSACDTANGSFQSGEGVYGLNRALTVAGSRSNLLSLWKVDDAATAFFMQRYYEQLKAGMGPMDALVAVQEEFRSDPPRKEWSDYRFWAAWQLVGDSGPIPGI